VAETFTIEGLDYMLGIFPKNGTNLATSYCGLWTGPGTASTIGTSVSATLASYTNLTEVPIGNWSYARQSIAGASWGSAGAGSGAAAGGRQCTAGQVTFPAATAASATPINGFFLCDLSTHGSEKSIFVANFDDTTAIASLAIGDIVKVTPTFGLLP
jgi:hypothetical protein